MVLKPQLAVQMMDASLDRWKKYMYEVISIFCILKKEKIKVYVTLTFANIPILFLLL